MAVIETWYTQDLQKPVKTKYLDGNMFSHNGNGNRIGVELYNNGEPLESITGTVSGYVVVSDGTTVPCVGDKGNNRAWILIPVAAYQPGNVFISIFLTDGTTVTTLAAVQTTVLQTRTGTQVDPGSVVADWTQTINAAMQEVETAADNVAGMVADYYSALTFPVPLGKYCIYNYNLYRCISPIATSENWTASHWTQVKLADDVSDLKSAFLHSVMPDNLLQAYRLEYAYINASGEIAASATTGQYVYDFILYQVVPGTIISSIKENTSLVARYAFFSGDDIPKIGDTSYNSSREGGTASTVTNVTVPSGVKWIGITCYHANYASLELVKNSDLTGYKGEYTGSLDDVKDNSIRYVSSSVATSPFTGQSACILYTNRIISSSYIQIAYATATAYKGIRKTRTFVSGAWTDWISYDDRKYIEVLGILADNTDLNNIAKDSVYLLNSTYTYSHKPDGITSGFIETAIINSNLAYQNVYSANDGFRFYRVKSSGTWGSWQNIKENTINQGQIANNTDLNSIDLTGIYTLNTNGNYTNTPTGEKDTAAFLFHYKPTSAVTLQIWMKYSNGLTRIRKKLNSTWSNWTDDGSNEKVGKIAMFGDSLTWGQLGGEASGTQTTHGLPYYVTQLTRLEASTTFAEGGMGWLPATTHESAYDHVKSFASVLDQYDVISFCYGPNDNQSTLGTYLDTVSPDDENPTIMGSIYNTMLYLKENFPDKAIILIGPTIHINYNSTFPEWDWNKQRPGGWTLKQMVEEYKKFADYYHIPFIDMTASPANSFNIDSLMHSNNDIHFYQKGYDLVGKWLAGQIAALYGA